MTAIDPSSPGRIESVSLCGIANHVAVGHCDLWKRKPLPGGVIGNTTGFGPVIRGSSPRRVATFRISHAGLLFDP